MDKGARGVQQGDREEVGLGQWYCLTPTVFSERNSFP